jgi:hypothetical protein
VNTIYKDTIKSERLVGRGTNNPISLLAVRKLIDAFGERLESIVDERHSKASGEPVSPDSMFRRYWRFTWSIGIFPSGSFILGDFGPLVMCGPELILNIAFSHTEKARAILLPIAHDLLLVGRSPGEEALQTPDPELINVATAELSREFFVSSQNGPQEARYLEHLGRRADEEKG